MKRLLWLAISLILSVLAYAQEPAKPIAQERMFFPHDTFWGYAQFDFAGPHNEIDPNICRADAGNFGGRTLLVRSLRAICCLAFWRFGPLAGGYSAAL